MNNTSIECPASYGQAVRMLGELLNIDTTNVIKINTMDELRTKSKSKLKYASQSIKVVSTDGKEYFYMVNFDGKVKRFDEYGITAKYFLVTTLKSLSEMGLQSNFIAKANISEGGGWYSVGSIYECNGVYYYG